METCRETRRKLAEGIGGLSGVHRELVRGDRELARKASGVRQKKTRDSSKDCGGCEKLARIGIGEVEGNTFSRFTTVVFLINDCTTQVGGCTTTVLFCE
ncbi:hypothetical protein GW17_00007620 [Ensete ventricosum]|nr:hypothetical protein GW17_00007620 [Ensete ventricosum]